MSTSKQIEKLVNEYANWLKAKTSLKQIGKWVEITTPYLDRHNDHIQIYAKSDNGNILLSDDGYTLSDLEMSGCKLESPKRQRLLTQTLNGFAVKLINNSTLQVIADEKNFSLKKHCLIQAILAVNDLFYLATPSIASLSKRGRTYKKKGGCWPPCLIPPSMPLHGRGLPVQGAV